MVRTEETHGVDYLNGVNSLNADHFVEKQRQNEKGQSQVTQNLTHNVKVFKQVTILTERQLRHHFVGLEVQSDRLKVVEYRRKVECHTHLLVDLRLKIVEFSYYFGFLVIIRNRI